MTHARRKALVLTAAVSGALAGCASKSSDIAASYVSPNTFAPMTCGQIGAEAQRLSQRASQAIATQDQKAADDAAATAVSLVLFWPAAFFVRGDKGGAAEVARLKGEMEAVEQASIQKKCNIRFRT